MISSPKVFLSVFITWIAKKCNSWISELTRALLCAIFEVCVMNAHTTTIAKSHKTCEVFFAHTRRFAIGWQHHHPNSPPPLLLLLQILSRAFIGVCEMNAHKLMT